MSDRRYHVEAALYRLNAAADAVDGNAMVLRSWVAEECAHLKTVRRTIVNNMLDFRSGALEQFPTAGYSDEHLPLLVVIDNVELEPDREYVAYARIHDGNRWLPWSRIGQNRLDFMRRLDSGKERPARDLPVSSPRPIIKAEVSAVVIPWGKDKTVTVTGDVTSHLPIESLWANNQEVELKTERIDTGYKSSFTTKQISLTTACPRIEVVAQDKAGNVSRAVKVYHPEYKDGKVVRCLTADKTLKSEETCPIPDEFPVYLRYLPIPYRAINAEDGQLQASVVAGDEESAVALKPGEWTRRWEPRLAKPPLQPLSTYLEPLHNRQAVVSCNPTVRMAVKEDPDAWLWTSREMLLTPNLPKKMDEALSAQLGQYVDASISGQEPPVAAPTALAAGFQITPAGENDTQADPMPLDAVKNGDAIQIAAYTMEAEPCSRMRCEEHIHADESPWDSASSQVITYETPSAKDLHIVLNTLDPLGKPVKASADEPEVKISSDITLTGVELESDDGRMKRYYRSPKQGIRLITQEYLNKASQQKAGQDPAPEKHQISPDGHLQISVKSDKNAATEPALQTTARTLEITKRWYVDGQPSLQPAARGTNPRVGGPGIHRVQWVNRSLADGSVYVHNGELFQAAEDLFVPGKQLPVSLNRVHLSHSLLTTPLGRNWDFVGNMRLVEMLNGDVVLLDGAAGLAWYKAVASKPAKDAGADAEAKKPADVATLEGLADKKLDYPKLYEQAQRQYTAPGGVYQSLMKGKPVALPGAEIPGKAEEARFYLVGKDGTIWAFQEDIRYRSLTDVDPTFTGKDEFEPPAGVHAQYLLVSVHPRIRANCIQFVRNAQGLVEGIIDDRGRVIRLIYDKESPSPMLTQVEDFAGRSITYGREKGNLVTVTGPTVRCDKGQGKETPKFSYQYEIGGNGPGQKLSSVTLPGEKRLMDVQKWDPQGRVSCQAVAERFRHKWDYCEGLTLHTIYGADSVGGMRVDMHSYRIKLSPSKAFAEVYAHIVTVTDPARTGTTTGDIITKYEYNPHSEVSKIIFPKGNFSQFTHVETGSQAGNLIHVRTGKDEETEITYEAAFNLPAVSEQIVFISEGKTSSAMMFRDYNESGLLLSVKESEVAATAYDYHPDGQIKTLFSPDGAVTKFEYYPQAGSPGDADTRPGMLCKQTVGGLALTIEPDILGMPAKTTGHDKVVEERIFNELGQLLLDATGESYVYSNGRLKTVTTPNPRGGRDSTKELTYDALGNILSVTHAGRTVKTEYDYMGNPLWQKDSVSGVTLYTYDERGLLLKKEVNSND